MNFIPEAFTIWFALIQVEGTADRRLQEKK